MKMRGSQSPVTSRRTGKIRDIKKLINLALILWINAFFLPPHLCAADEKRESAVIGSGAQEFSYEDEDMEQMYSRLRNEQIIFEEINRPLDSDVPAGPDSEEEAEQPIVVNADKIEYSADTRYVIATGNVEVDYKGSKMTCQKMIINTLTKDAEAEGGARLEDDQGVKEGAKITYNFETKNGTIIDADFRSNPYFGRAERIDKPGPEGFIIKKGYLTTCSLDHPHWRIAAKKANYYPNDKLQTRGDTLYFWNIPLLYIPEYNHSLKDPLMHVQLVPGKRKEWGGFLLTTWRCNLNEHINGSLQIDSREYLGFAYGYKFNYNSPNLGKGNVKYYYTEEDPAKFEPKDAPNTEFQRAITRWRHKWVIAEQTTFITEFFKLLDSKRKKAGSKYDFLKEYFFTEYEKDIQPITYAQFHHSFPYSSVDVYLQKRINHWFSDLNIFPQINYSLPSLQFGDTPFYLDNSSSFSNMNKKPPANTVDAPEENSTRFNTSLQFSMPLKIWFVCFNPNIKLQETYYTKDIYGSSTVFRTVFYSGAEISTKFYRIFDIKSNFLGMDINRIRHIITPTINYTYQHLPTVPSSKLIQMDGTDAIGGTSQSASFQLSNKLQTKRSGESVDMLDFRVSSTYTLKPKGGDKRGSSFSDILFNLELLPYSWLRIVGDSTLRHSGNKNDALYGKIVNGNVDFEFDFGKDRLFGIGGRYERKGGNSMTYALKWRVSPKWKFYIYHRRQFSKTATLKSGLREQEYSISRDLHCWEVDLSYNVTQGVSKQVWLMFRLKAFPEMEFDYNQIYHQPKPGTQSEPNTG